MQALKSYNLKALAFLLLSLCVPHSCDVLRLDIFSTQFIDEVNKEADTWVAGHNFPTNTSWEELGYLLDLTTSTSGILPHRNRLLSEDFDLQKGSLSAESESDSFPVNPQDIRIPATLKEVSIPVSFDAREHWSHCPDIGKVYDQGACPSAYAFSVVPAFNDRRCILSNGKKRDSMSIQYLLSCCHACKYDDSTRRCGVGQPLTAWWFLHKRGIVTGGDYGSNEGCQPVSFPPCLREYSENGPLCKDQTAPELRCRTRCTNENYGLDYSQDRHRGKVQYWVKPAEKSIQEEVLKNGPVSVQITTYEDFLHYKSGVYHHVSGGRFNHQHTLKLIGWGVEHGRPYWLLINSWGRSWGDHGTVKILRGRAECNLEYYVSAGVPKKDW